MLFEGLIVGANSTSKTSPGIQYFRIEPFLKPYLDRIIQKVGIENWPKTSILRTAPNIDKSLLSKPKLITRESISRGLTVFADETLVGGGGRWSLDCVVKNPDPLPKELPEKRKAWLLEHMPLRIRNDPNLFKAYMARKLNDYKKSMMYRIKGSMEVDLCLAPNPHAACEYLIYYHRGCSIPAEAIARQFSESKRLKNLGTIAFGENWKGFSKIMLVRDNIAMVIDARGELASEALSLAQEIDELIRRQPALTHEQLLARRPSITIAPKAEKTLAEGQWAVSFDTSAPAGQEIVDVRSYVDGQLSGIEDHRVVITNKKKGQSVRVKVITTTSELLTNATERQVTIPE
jgi:hypothetical protein